MNEKSLEKLLAEREALTDKLLNTPKEDDLAFLSVCNEIAMHFFKSLETVMNQTPEPLAFLAIFTLRHFADSIARQVDGAEEAANDYVSLVDVETISLKLPHLKRKKDEEEDEDDGTADV